MRSLWPCSDSSATPSFPSQPEAISILVPSTPTHSTDQTTVTQTGRDAGERCQAPLSMGYSRQEDWSGFPCPPPGDLPHPGIEPASPLAPALQPAYGHVQCKRRRRHGFDPWVGKIPWRRAWQPTPVFSPGEPQGHPLSPLDCDCLLDSSPLITWARL